MNKRVARTQQSSTRTREIGFFTFCHHKRSLTMCVGTGSHDSPSSKPCRRRAGRCIPPVRTAARRRRPGSLLCSSKKEEGQEEEEKSQTPCCCCCLQELSQRCCCCRRRGVAENLQWNHADARRCLLLLNLVGLRRRSGRVPTAVSTRGDRGRSDDRGCCCGGTRRRSRLISCFFCSRARRRSDTTRQVARTTKKGQPGDRQCGTERLKGDAAQQRHLNLQAFFGGRGRTAGGGVPETLNCFDGKKNTRSPSFNHTRGQGARI